MNTLISPNLKANTIISLLSQVDIPSPNCTQLPSPSKKNRPKMGRKKRSIKTPPRRVDQDLEMSRAEKWPPGRNERYGHPATYLGGLTRRAVTRDAGSQCGPRRPPPPPRSAPVGPPACAAPPSRRGRGPSGPTEAQATSWPEGGGWFKPRPGPPPPPRNRQQKLKK